MKIKEISEKLLLQNQRATNPEGSKFFQIGRGPNPEGLVFTKPEVSQSGGVLYLLTQRGSNPGGLNFANPEGTSFCQSGGVLFFLSTRRGIILLKDLGKQKKRL